MIEELGNRAMVDRDGNCYGMAPPGVYEIVEKINEIIHYLNSKEK